MKLNHCTRVDTGDGCYYLCRAVAFPALGLLEPDCRHYIPKDFSGNPSKCHTREYGSRCSHPIAQEEADQSRRQYKWVAPDNEPDPQYD